MAEVAGQMTSAVDQWVPSWVERVSGDSGAVLAETGRGWLSRSEVELIRHVVVAARLGGVTATRHLLDEAELSLQGDQHGLAATSKLGVTGEIPERPPGLMWLQFVRLRCPSPATGTNGNEHETTVGEGPRKSSRELVMRRSRVRIPKAAPVLAPVTCGFVRIPRTGMWWSGASWLQFWSQFLRRFACRSTWEGRGSGR